MLPMSMKFLFAPVIALGLVLPAVAEEKAPSLTPAAVEQIQLAATLARYGEARKDPILLIAAARIAKGVSPDGAPAADKLPSMDEMLSDAKEYAEGDETVIGLIDDVKASQSKGYCYGDHGLGWC
jgi:hypothetical protein